MMHKKRLLLLLPLIAMLFGAVMVNVGTAPPPPAKLYIDPPRVDGQPPMDFRVSIMVENVEDLYSAGFTLQYAPYVSTLVASDVQEGDFLGQDGNLTAFTYKINPFAGTVKIGMTRLGTVPGISGDGELASMKLTVIEAGDSPIDINDDYLIDSAGLQINHNTWNGEYNGPTAKLIRIQLVSGRKVTVGGTQIFAAKVKNNDYHWILYARVRFDVIRDDGRRIRLYTGQTYVSTPREPKYLYVNEYSPWLEWDWTNVGASVFGTHDGNYTESIINAAMTSSYGFEDITLNPGDVIGRVSLEGYCQYPNGPTDAVDIDVYTTSFAWLGSLYGKTAWSWVSPRWIGDDVSDVLPSILGSDASVLNGLEVLLYNYEGNADNPIRVDALRLKVEFSQLDPVVPPVWYLLPQVELELDPAMLILGIEDLGTYYVTATVEYTIFHSNWILGDKGKTRVFLVVEP